MRVAEDAEPVEFRFGDEIFQDVQSLRTDSPGKPTMKLVRRAMPGTAARNFVQSLEENIGASAALHALEHVGRGVLKRQVEIFADVVVLRDGVEKFAGDAIGIGVEEAEPAEIWNAGERVEQSGETIAEAEIFAVAGGVLADEGDFADAASDELLRLRRRRIRSGANGICRAGWE